MTPDTFCGEAIVIYKEGREIDVKDTLIQLGSDRIPHKPRNDFGFSKSGIGTDEARRHQLHITHTPHNP